MMDNTSLPPPGTVLAAPQNTELLRARFMVAEKLRKERIDLLRTDYMEFLKQVFRTLNPDCDTNPDNAFVANWHIDAINAHLTALERRDFRRLVINIPPRCTKTIATTITWVAWLIGHNPHLKFMLATYSRSIAERNMTDLKKVLESRWYRQCFPQFAINPVQNTKKKFLTTKGGHVISGSVNSKDFTAEGADCLEEGSLVDTPGGPRKIEDLRKGDKVFSFDHSRQKVLISDVVAARAKPSGDIYEIHTASGHTIRCTGNHPVYIEGAGYVRAEKLSVGDGMYILGEVAISDLPSSVRKLQTTLIASISVHRGGTKPVYDIQVKGTHNFFAGGILVHNCILVDDPHDPTMAMSDKERESACRWFTSTLPNRLNNKKRGIILVVMQRLHEDDLSGHLLEKGGWEHLCLQAKAEHTVTIKCGDFKRVFRKGELLDPVRLSQEVLDDLAKDMTAYSYAGQFQQNPAPDEGGIIKKKHWRKWGGSKSAEADPPSCDYVIQTLDTAFEEGEEADESVIETWGIFTAQGLDGEMRPACILLDCVSGNWGYPELKAAALKQYQHHKPDRVIIEKKASGQSLLQDLRRMRLPVIAFKPERDKIYRANISVIVLEKGHVFYMDRDWAKEVIKQCAVFPNGVHDDKVDATTIAWLYLRKRFWLGLKDDDAANDRPEQKGQQPKPRRLYGRQAGGERRG